MSELLEVITELGDIVIRQQRIIVAQAGAIAQLGAAANLSDDAEEIQAIIQRMQEEGWIERGW